MMDMKSQAIEKLMGVLDELLGGDAKARMKAALEKSEGEEEAPEVELPEGKEVASGGSAILALPELKDDEPGSEESEMKPPSDASKLAGLSVKETEVAALPKPSMMKKMRGKV
jgi:hypothetical protein